MKTITLLLTIIIGLNLNAQVVLNGGFQAKAFRVNASDPYTVSTDSTFIITYLTGPIIIENTEGLWVESTYAAEPDAIVHLPIPGGFTISNVPPNSAALFGYLISSESFAVNIQDSEEDEEARSQVMKVFPNPTQDNVTVFVDYTGKWTLKVFDMSGRIILDSIQNKQVKNLTKNDLPTGTYIVTASTSSGLIGSEKLVIQ
jgi:hypothetical protein